jgi:hypothetical protein
MSNGSPPEGDKMSAVKLPAITPKELTKPLGPTSAGMDVDVLGLQAELRNSIEG